MEEIRDTAAKLVPAGIPAAFFERMMVYELRELGDGFVAQIVANSGPLFARLSDGPAGQVRNAHNSSLATSLEGNKWVTTLADYVWTVEAGIDLILPDAVALACEDKGRLRPLLFATAAETNVVVMPVSSDRILVGRAPGNAQIDLEKFNTQAAASCDAFFVAAKPFKGGKLAALIGSALFRAIDEVVSATAHDAEKARSSIEKASDPIEPRVFAQRGFSYGVKLVDFGDEMLAKELADVLNSVVGALAQDLPLHDLDGITLAANFHDALTTVDRGDPNLPPVTGESLSYGQGVGKPVTVIREGARKEHLVIAASVAMRWLSPDAKERAIGLYALTKLLAGVAHSTQYASAQECTFAPDAMGRAMHRAVATTPTSFWSARQAAFVEPDQGQVLADLVIDGLDFAECQIAEERARIPENGDIGNATIRALECASAVLGHAADWLGHRDGLAEGEVFAGSDLPERLRARGLDQWIALFGRDLAACYGHHDTLDLEVVTSLSQHVERLFWSLGIYCWPDEDDVRCQVSTQPFFPPQLPQRGESQ